VTFPSPSPSFLFLALAPFFARAGKTPKIPFLGLTLLPNPSEALATQATVIERYSTQAEITLVVDVASEYAYTTEDSLIFIPDKFVEVHHPILQSPWNVLI